MKSAEKTYKLSDWAVTEISSDLCPVELLSRNVANAEILREKIARTRSHGARLVSADSRTYRKAEVAIPSIGNGRQLRELYKLSFRQGAETLPQKIMACKSRRLLISRAGPPVPSFHFLPRLSAQSFTHNLDLRILHHDDEVRRNAARIVPICFSILFASRIL